MTSPVGPYYVHVKKVYDDCFLACKINDQYGMNVKIDGIDITDAKKAKALIEVYTLDKSAKVVVVDDSHGYASGNVTIMGYDLAQLLVTCGVAVWSLFDS